MQGCFLCPELWQMERKMSQGRLAAGPFTLLCLTHVSISRSCCQQLSLAETELRGGCTGKQPLNAACVSSAITVLEWPCHSELCRALGTKMKGNGKLWLHYFNADCTKVSGLLEEELGPSQLTWDLCSSAIIFCFRKMYRTKPADREKLSQILSHRRISTNAFLTWKRICLCNIVPWWAYIDFFFKYENIWCNILEKLEKQISLWLNIICHLKNAN